MRTLLPLSVLLAFAAASAAENGLTGGQILNRPMGARPCAMGQAFVSIPGGADSLTFNPAGTAFVDKAEISLTYLRGFAGDGHGLAVIPVNLGPVVITPAYLYYNSGVITLNLSDGTHKDVIAREDKVGIIAAAVKPLAGLAIGAAAKFSKFTLGDTASATGRHYDVGLLYSSPWGVNIGAALQNSGNAIKFEEVGDPPPRTSRAGVSYRTAFNPPSKPDSDTDMMYCETTLSADWVQTDQERAYYQTGLELNLKTDSNFAFSLRGGYLLDRAAETCTFGAGVRQQNWSLDYANGANSINALHQFTLSYRF